jgi:hypothetical protein
MKLRDRALLILATINEFHYLVIIGACLICAVVLGIGAINKLESKTGFPEKAFVAGGKSDLPHTFAKFREMPFSGWEYISVGNPSPQIEISSSMRGGEFFEVASQFAAKYIGLVPKFRSRFLDYFGSGGDMRLDYLGTAKSSKEHILGHVASLFSDKESVQYIQARSRAVVFNERGDSPFITASKDVPFEYNVAIRDECSLYGHQRFAAYPIRFDHLIELPCIDARKLYSDKEQECVQDYLRPVNAMPPFRLRLMVVGVCIAIIGFCVSLRGAPSWTATFGVFCVALGAILALWSV